MFQEEWFLEVIINKVTQLKEVLENPEVQSYKHVYMGYCTPYTSAEIKNVAAVSQGGILFIHCLFQLSQILTQFAQFIQSLNIQGSILAEDADPQMRATG